MNDYSANTGQFKKTIIQPIMPEDLCTALGISSLSPLSSATDVTDATLGESGFC